MARLQVSQVVEAPMMDVFKILSDPYALSDLLAPVLQVEVQSAESALSRGQEMTFLMSRFGLSQVVRLRVEDILMGRRLTVRQTLGLFKEFVHTVRCEEAGAQQTLVTETVEFEVPFGFLGLVMSDVWVKRDLQNLLNIRLQRAQERLNPSPLRAAGAQRSALRTDFN